MCTLTLIPTECGFRLVTNRDESRQRPRALAPALREASGCRAVWPVDPRGGGTWVAATDAGLALSILNYNPAPAGELPVPPRAQSRGAIIPAIIGAGASSEAITALASLDLERFLPFRLVAADREAIAVGRWDGEALSVERRALAPSCFVSSGLGDALVAPRLELFDRWMAERGATAEAQDAFHEHQWPDRTEISVRMSRPDARTVSTTTVEVDGNAGAAASVRMGHRDDDGETWVEAPALAGASALSDERGGC